ncbi:hypothetical protein HaLaN_14933, partial [Haematococcus lacustris]
GATAAEKIDPEEQLEILLVMAVHEFTLANVKQWDLNRMEELWRAEIKARRSTLKLLPPEQRYTLLPSNRVISTRDDLEVAEEEFKELSDKMLSRAARLALLPAGPSQPQEGAVSTG